MSGKIGVRRAQVEDVFKIVKLLVDHSHHSEWPRPEPEFPYAYQILMETLALGFSWVARREEEIVGVLLLSPRKMWYERELSYLQADEFFVHPDYRRTSVGKVFLKKGRETADKLKVPIEISIETGIRAKAKDRFVSQAGFRYMGGNLLYQPEKGEAADETG